MQEMKGVTAETLPTNSWLGLFLLSWPRPTLNLTVLSTETLHHPKTEVHEEPGHFQSCCPTKLSNLVEKEYKRDQILH